jgi:hypothetical protein
MADPPMSKSLAKLDALDAIIERDREARKRANPQLPMLQIDLQENVETVRSVAALASGDVPTISVCILPGDRHALLAGLVIERAHVRAIDRLHINRLAEILEVEPTDEFCFRIHDAIIGFSFLILHGWHSPRWHRKFYDELARDPTTTIERHRDDPLAQLWIKNIAQHVDGDLRDPIAMLNSMSKFVRVVRAFDEDMRSLIKPGPGNDNPVTLFWHSVALIARRCGCDLKLPQRDTSRGGIPSTPYFAFALAMRDLLVEHAAQIPVKDDGGRLARMRAAKRGRLIDHLRGAREEISL